MIWPTLMKRTVLECGRVALAKIGRDPYGMLLKDQPWRVVIPKTYRAHRDWLRRSR